MKEIEIESLIFSFLENRATAKEIKLLEDFIDESDENKKYFMRFVNIYESCNSDVKYVDTKKALKGLIKNISDKKQRRLFKILQTVAAILFFPVTVLLVYQNYIEKDEVVVDSLYEISTIHGTHGYFVLPDSSIVWLNANSTLAYPLQFKGVKREVFLKGEAYFDVKADREHPFSVVTSSMTVMATGTSFNVSDFDKSVEKEVTLVCGNVSVMVGNLPPINMKPNQHLKYNFENKKSILSDGHYKYYAWKDNKLVFRNDPISEVIKKISRCYGVEIELKNEEMMDYVYHATFEDESLYDILKLLKLSAPIDYKEIKRVQNDDGTFSERRIIIYKK